MQQRFQVKTIGERCQIFDTQTKILVLFERGKFNETQAFHFLDDVKYDAVALAKVMRLFGEVVVEYHL